MSKNFFYFLLSVLLMISLTACNKTNPTSTKNNPSSTDITNNQTISNQPVTTPEKNVGVESIPVNVSVPDAILPPDIPVFPNAKPMDKRLTNKITTFVFSTNAITNEVENFYKDALKKEGWSKRLEQQNVADGNFFTKPKRTVRVIAYRDGQLNKTVFRLSLFDATKEEGNSTMEVMGEDGKLVKRITAANLNDAGKMPLGITSTTPLYPGAQQKASERPGIWWEYKTKDPVKKIADWYDKELKTIGWVLEQDNSELGDSMMIYSKKDEKANNMHIGIRVNDMKDKSERWITLINYPYNAVIPDLKTFTEVEQEQPEAAKIARDLAKKNQEKNSKSAEQSIKEVTPAMQADFDATRQATRERAKKIIEERQKAKEKAISATNK